MDGGQLLRSPMEGLEALAAVAKIRGVAVSAPGRRITSKCQPNYLDDVS